MKKTTKNGFEISEFTLGTVQLGIPYGINNKSGMPSKQTSFDILKAAENAGITSFDTAGAYGTSEDILGEYFFASKGSPSIITKVHPQDASPENLFDSLVKEVRTSLSRLNLSALPFLLLHHERYITKYGDALLNALCRLKSEGLVANIGVSFSEKDKLTELCTPDVFDCVQVPLNLFDSKEIHDGSIAKLHRHGISVFVRSVFLQGVFFMNPKKLPPHLQTASEPLMKIRELAEAENMGITEFALSFIRESEGVGSVVLGCETVSQVEENASLFGDRRISEVSRRAIENLTDNISPVVTRPWEWPKGV